MRFAPRRPFTHTLAMLCAAALLTNCSRRAPEPAIAPAPLEAPAPARTPLPAPSPLDETLIIDIGAPQAGIGTAFAINTTGDWITARHVVDGCLRIEIEYAPGMRVPAEALHFSDTADLAHLSAEAAPHALVIGAAADLYQGEDGFFTGYPQGRAGDVAARLAGHARLVTQGRRKSNLPVLAWIEQSRSPGAEGTLSGLSGAPVFGADGVVRGLVVAESASRSRLYTTPPGALSDFIAETGIAAPATEIASIDAATYRDRAAEARRNSQIVPVYCEVDP